MTLSPRTLVGLAAALALAVFTLALSLALTAPTTGLHFTTDSDNRLLLAGSGKVVSAFIAGGEQVPVDGALAIEEPDMLPTYGDYRAFMQQQSRLTDALAAGDLRMVLDDGGTVDLVSRPRHIADLPLLFWLQVLFGVGGMMTGALVLAAQPRQRAARLYALTGLGYLVFAPAAAVYSTRELLLDGGVFRLLSVANHFGALLFTGSLTALLCSYPVRLGRLPLVASIYALSLAAFLVDTLQLPTRMEFFHFSVLTIFVLSFVFAGVQWWKTRRAPADRAALRWFLLSIYLATGLFAGVIIVPAALGVPPPASQGVMFGAFLVMYWGLALGIVRYRLFQLAHWWHAIWWWFMGGLAVVLVDVLLISTLAFSEALALSVSVAVVGWLYFPLRQWVWARFGSRRERKLAEWLPDALPLLIETGTGGSSETLIRERWPALLAAVFRPLEIEHVAASGGVPCPTRIIDDGLALSVPDVREGEGCLLLRHADGGARLFSRADLETLVALRKLFDLALDRLRARDAGARVERERIRRDIHDDLGAKLLTLLHTTSPESQPLVREAIDDMRVLVRALEFEAQPLRDALDGWQAEARKRAEGAGVSLQWQEGDCPADAVLNARQLANITRVVREGISNALKHAAPTALGIDIVVAGGQLRIGIRNDGRVKPQADWPEGRGRQIMKSRMAELGGDVSWQATEGACLLQVTVPL